MMIMLTPSPRSSYWEIEFKLPEFLLLADLFSQPIFLWQTHQDSESSRTLKKIILNAFFQFH